MIEFNSFFSESFLPSFLPNFASTVIGVIFGVPIALWLNRKAQNSFNLDRQKEQKDQLFHGLQSISEALEINRKKLDELVLLLEANNAVFELMLDYAAWDAAREQIVSVLRNAELQRKIAYHFEQLKKMSRTCERYLDMAIGIQSAMSGIEEKRNKLKVFLINRSKGLSLEARALGELIKDAMPKQKGLMKKKG
ncbi:hypothetical protein EBX31_10040 [bacterium]|nr:hypothetical protein [bacterium]